MIRERPYKIGDVVYTKQPANSHWLPEGLPDRVKVKVLDHSYGGVLVEYQSQTFRVSDRCIDNGDEIELRPGQYQPYRIAGYKEPLARWRNKPIIPVS